MSAEVALLYRIDFENDATATAPAQIVTLTDQLDPNLDWSTFALTEIGFGDHLIAVPANAQHFETTVPVHYNGQDFDVQIEAGIHLATGQVFAHFYSIDPDTSLPPDVLTGFLPPEDGTGRGMGHVSYLTDQKPGLATGTEIRNIALIVFDGQPAIATNQVDPHDPSKGTDPAKEALNTIDAGAPTSAVQPLPPTRTRPDFLVQWTATDDAGGSGVASHDIYVATDGGSYVLWQDDITATSATFTGQAGHSYAFYSVAQDHVGNTEAAPASPDVTTQILERLAVTAVTTDASGVAIRFNRPLDPTTLNLYATETAGHGPADVTLVGAATGPVVGSLVLDDDLQGFRFVSTGGPLAPDSYRLTLVSGQAGFDDVFSALDGNGDGTPGDDWRVRFNVHPAGAGVLSLPDFMRGPGQTVDILPASDHSLPVTFSSAGGLRQLVFTRDHDPDLLVITDARAASGLPVGSVVRFESVANDSGGRRAVITVLLPERARLAAGSLRLVDLVAHVPVSAPYGARQIIELSVKSIDGRTPRAGSVADDAAVHLVGYLADASGDAAYTSLDGAQIKRVVANGPGFAAYPNIDPLIVADIDGNGRLTSLDAKRVLQEASYLAGTSRVDRLEIPPIPAGVGPPKIAILEARAIAVDAVANPGELFTVPLGIDRTAGVQAVQVQVAYDASRFELVDVRREAVSGDFGWLIGGQEPGRITVDLSRLDALPEGGGTLLAIDLRVRAGALPGVSAIDLQYTRRTDGRAILGAMPQVAVLAPDGRITVAGQVTAEPARPVVPTAGVSSTIAPVIDFAASFSLPSAVNEAMAADSHRKPWLKDYLGNVGQARQASANAGLKVTVPALAATRPAARCLS